MLCPVWANQGLFPSLLELNSCSVVTKRFKNFWKLPGRCSEPICWGFRCSFVLLNLKKTEKKDLSASHHLSFFIHQNAERETLLTGQTYLQKRLFLNEFILSNVFSFSVSSVFFFFFWRCYLRTLDSKPFLKFLF